MLVIDDENMLVPPPALMRPQMRMIRRQVWMLVLHHPAQPRMRMQYAAISDEREVTMTGRQGVFDQIGRARPPHPT